MPRIAAAIESPASKPEREPEAESDRQAAPAPATEQPAARARSSRASDPQSLNQRGFELMNEGRYDEAIPVLQRAVDSFDAGSQDLTYAYALYNLGRSLRLAGRPRARRSPCSSGGSRSPTSRKIVKEELKQARQGGEGLG